MGIQPVPPRLDMCKLLLENSDNCLQNTLTSTNDRRLGPELVKMV